MKISQALIDRYSSEQAFKDFSKSLGDLKLDLNSQVAKGLRPLELRIGDISNTGKVEVNFTKKINFPDNLAQYIKDS